MATETASGLRVRADWLPRAIVSGFIATVTMSFAFFIAYAVARLASHVELRSGVRGSATFTDWMAALTNNPVLDLAASSLYTSGTLHLAVGVVWAIAYAYFFEPRLTGAGWLRGIIFSLVPWILSLLVFLPLVGGGIAGAALGAGPLPAIGNLILHLVYGATLGTVYGPLGDIPADEFPSRGQVDAPGVVSHYEGNAAKGIVVGAALGGVVGIAGSLLAGTNVLPLGISPLAFLPVTVVLGASFGALIGSIAGLAPGTNR